MAWNWVLFSDKIGVWDFFVYKSPALLAPNRKLLKRNKKNVVEGKMANKCKFCMEASLFICPDESLTAQ